MNPTLAAGSEEDWYYCWSVDVKLESTPKQAPEVCTDWEPCWLNVTTAGSVCLHGAPITGTLKQFVNTLSPCCSVTPSSVQEWCLDELHLPACLLVVLHVVSCDVVVVVELYEAAFLHLFVIWKQFVCWLFSLGSSRVLPCSQGSARGWWQDDDDYITMNYVTFLLQPAITPMFVLKQRRFLSLFLCNQKWRAL